jgi:hypothetical protein
MGWIVIFLFLILFVRTPSLFAGGLAFLICGTAAFVVTRMRGKPRGMVRTAVIVGLGLLAGVPAAFKAGHADFDSIAWRAEGSSRSHWPVAYSARERMVDDLLENVLPGLTLQEVRARLGPSESSAVEGVLSYTIGPHPIIDDAVLFLHFAKDGRYERYEWGNN